MKIDDDSYYALYLNGWCYIMPIKKTKIEAIKELEKFICKQLGIKSFTVWIDKNNKVVNLYVREKERNKKKV